jgi:hypothetical protein
MCYEFESRFLRARALEALRRKPKEVDEPRPAAPTPSAAPIEPAAPTVTRDEDTVPA